MFEFIKNTILGSRIFNRSNSVEVESKIKEQLEKKRPFSFDSKQKQKKEGLKTSKRHQYHQIIAFDETMTIKKASPYSKGQDQRNKLNFDDGVISDIDDEDRGLDQLMTYPKTSIISNANLRDQQRDTTNIKKIDSTNIPKSFIIDQSNRKIRIKRQSPKRFIRKIQQKCTVCQQALNYSDSLQLACTHRYHKSCAIQMQWRMRYKCDICQMKNDHNKGSIVLRGVSRKRNN